MDEGRPAVPKMALLERAARREVAVAEREEGFAMMQPVGIERIRGDCPKGILLVQKNAPCKE